MALPPVSHVFVLMLENRSFDHLLGFSNISGTDAVTGQRTSIAGLSGKESNSYNGNTFTVIHPADYSMPVDPGHEFTDVLVQLSGPAATYTPGGPYPPINCSGYVASYAAKAGPQQPAGEILKCFSPDQLPILNTLAREFAVCDHWHASMPGPTWPNRMFVHAASSAGLDHSPTTAEIALWEITSGFSFPNGHIFDRLASSGRTRRLYAGDSFPMMAALKGIGLGDIRPYSDFANDLKGSFPFNYAFIEPSYRLLDEYRGSTSEHPLGDIRLGEGLIKDTYEAIRNSPVWDSSVLILTWDEHGGFYDHVPPPAAVAPGDTSPSAPHNKFGFTFAQYGPRVPAVIISPLIPKNTIDHRLYDHSSVPATLEALFGLQPLTARDRSANNILPLLSLATPRTDAPTTLPSPQIPAAPLMAVGMAHPVSYAAQPPARPHDSINDGNLPVIVQSAMRQDIELSAPGDRSLIVARVASLKTREDAAKYLAEVEAKRTAAKLE